MTNETITTKQAAQMLHCTTNHVNLLCRKGKIKAVRPFGVWIIDKAALESKIRGEIADNGTATTRFDI